jgi:hypothetical protein
VDIPLLSGEKVLTTGRCVGSQGLPDLAGLFGIKTKPWLDQFSLDLGACAGEDFNPRRHHVSFIDGVTDAG